MIGLQRYMMSDCRLVKRWMEDERSWEDCCHERSWEDDGHASATPWTTCTINGSVTSSCLRSIWSQ
jgi:hypothetical protein